MRVAAIQRVIASEVSTERGNPHSGLFPATLLLAVRNDGINGLLRILPSQ
jgi:hypothetical protein